MRNIRYLCNDQYLIEGGYFSDRERKNVKSNAL